jgi:hypothetical protein
LTGSKTGKNRKRPEKTGSDRKKPEATGSDRKKKFLSGQKPERIPTLVYGTGDKPCLLLCDTTLQNAMHW